MCGLYLKKKYPNIKWVSDMRDPMNPQHMTLWRRLLCTHWQSRILKKADEIVTISTALADQIGAGKRTVHVVENGYAPAPIEATAPRDQVLRIGYTGQLYDGMRDMSSLFRAISDLQAERGEKLPLEIHYAGNSVDELMSQVGRYGMEEYIVNHGLVSKKESTAIQEFSDILCVLSWNTEKEQGVLTGKFPEYLRMKKPILAIITGELANAELTERVRKMKVGFAYEQINEDKEFGELKKWLSEALAFKERGESLPFFASDEDVERFSYPSLIARLDAILKK